MEEYNSIKVSPLLVNQIINLLISFVTENVPIYNKKREKMGIKEMWEFLS